MLHKSMYISNFEGKFITAGEVLITELTQIIPLYDLLGRLVTNSISIDVRFIVSTVNFHCLACQIVDEKLLPSTLRNYWLLIKCRRFSLSVNVCDLPRF